MVDGDYCGKYVHQIYHQYEDGQTTVMLAVIHQTDECLLGKCLELSPSELCVVYETKEENSCRYQYLYSTG